MKRTLLSVTILLSIGCASAPQDFSQQYDPPIVFSHNRVLDDISQHPNQSGLYSTSGSNVYWPNQFGRFPEEDLQKWADDYHYCVYDYAFPYVDSFPYTKNSDYTFQYLYSKCMQSRDHREVLF